MGKSVNVRCTICGSQKFTFIPNKYGESGNRSEEVFVAGCDKCAGKPKYKETVSHSSSGGYAGGGSGGDGGCLGTLGALFMLGLISVCCCGGLGGKS